MRILIAATLALLLALSPAAADDYGERLCKQYMPPGTPCPCVAPILEEEFDEEELEPLMQFLRSFMTGLEGRRSGRPEDHRPDRRQARQERPSMDWLKRFEGLSPETAKTCKFKF